MTHEPEQQPAEQERTSQERNKKLLLIALTVGLGAAFACLLVWRRPDAIFNAQFWAEDGFRWYANVYNWGPLKALLTPAGGYFQTISHGTAALSLLVPMERAPLLFSAVALVIQTLPPLFFTSSRFSHVVPHRWLRVVIGLAYIALPASFEVHVNVTNSMTHLGLLALLIIIAKPSKKLAWRIFDVGAILLAGLSGPYVIFFTPVAWFMYWKTKDRWTRTIAMLATVPALIQIFSIITTSSDRSHAALGASPEVFLRIIGNQIVTGGLLGVRSLAEFSTQPWWTNNWLPIGLGVLALIFIGYCLWKGPLQLKMLILFACATLAAALLKPQVSTDEPQWLVLMRAGFGNRYYIYLITALIVAAIWAASKSKSKFFRVVGIVFVAGFIVRGIPQDWFFAPYENFRWADQVKTFEAAPSGQPFRLRIAPGPWEMELIKK